MRRLCGRQSAQVRWASHLEARLYQIQPLLARLLIIVFEAARIRADSPRVAPGVDPEPSYWYIGVVCRRTRGLSQLLLFSRVESVLCDLTP